MKLIRWFVLFAAFGYTIFASWINYTIWHSEDDLAAMIFVIAPLLILLTFSFFFEASILGISIIITIILIINSYIAYSCIGQAKQDAVWGFGAQMLVSWFLSISLSFIFLLIFLIKNKISHNKAPQPTYKNGAAGL